MSEALLDIQGLRAGYGPLEVLRGIDMRIAPGEIVAVLGSNGVGKSTLLGVLTGLVPRFSGGTLSRDVLIDGVSVIDQPLTSMGSPGAQAIPVWAPVLRPVSASVPSASKLIVTGEAASASGPVISK